MTRFLVGASLNGRVWERWEGAFAMINPRSSSLQVVNSFLCLPLSRGQDGVDVIRRLVRGSADGKDVEGEGDSAHDGCSGLLEHHDCNRIIRALCVKCALV